MRKQFIIIILHLQKKCKISFFVLGVFYDLIGRLSGGVSKCDGCVRMRLCEVFGAMARVE